MKKSDVLATKMQKLCEELIKCLLTLSLKLRDMINLHVYLMVTIGNIAIIKKQSTSTLKMPRNISQQNLLLLGFWSSECLESFCESFEFSITLFSIARI